MAVRRTARSQPLERTGLRHRLRALARRPTSGLGAPAPRCAAARASGDDSQICCPDRLGTFPVSERPRVRGGANGANRVARRGRGGCDREPSQAVPLRWGRSRCRRSRCQWPRGRELVPVVAVGGAVHRGGGDHARRAGGGKLIIRAVVGPLSGSPVVSPVHVPSAGAVKVTSFAPGRGVAEREAAAGGGAGGIARSRQIHTRVSSSPIGSKKLTSSRPRRGRDLRPRRPWSHCTRPGRS